MELASVLSGRGASVALTGHAGPPVRVGVRPYGYAATSDMNSRGRSIARAQLLANSITMVLDVPDSTPIELRNLFICPSRLDERNHARFRRGQGWKPRF